MKEMLIAFGVIVGLMVILFVGTAVFLGLVKLFNGAYHWLIPFALLCFLMAACSFCAWKMIEDHAHRQQLEAIRRGEQ